MPAMCASMTGKTMIMQPSLNALSCGPLRKIIEGIDYVCSLLSHSSVPLLSEFNSPHKLAARAALARRARTFRSGEKKQAGEKATFLCENRAKRKREAKRSATQDFSYIGPPFHSSLNTFPSLPPQYEHRDLRAVVEARKSTPDRTPRLEEHRHRGHALRSSQVHSPGPAKPELH